MAEAVAVDRTLPHNLEAERSVLGAVLIHNDAFNQAAEVLTPRDFYRDAHRRIFEKMIQLSERGNAIDFVTLKEELSRAGELDEVGGPAYIAALVDGLPHATNVEYYARIVREKSTLRNLIFSANKILATAYEAEQEPNLILDEAEQSIFAIAEDRVRAGFVSMRQLAHASFAAIEQAHERKQLITGVPSGFTDLDELTAGFQSGDLVIIAARPSVGKTALVLNIAQHVGTKTGRTVGIFSLEMSKEQLFLRMLTSEARIDSHRLRTGFLVESDWGRLSHALGTLSEAKVFIDDTPGIGVLEMRAKSRRLMAEHGLDLLIIDYIQLMQATRPLREPHARAGGDLALAEDAGEGAERAGRHPVAAEPRARSAIGPPADALGPARVRRPRAGRRCRHAAVPPRSVSRREARRREHRRGQHRQAAQRPDRPRPARVHEIRDALRQSRTHR